MHCVFESNKDLITIFTIQQLQALQISQRISDDLKQLVLVSLLTPKRLTRSVDSESPRLERMPNFATDRVIVDIRAIPKSAPNVSMR
jgi:hypothetical protein